MFEIGGTGAAKNDHNMPGRGDSAATPLKTARFWGFFHDPTLYNT